MAETVTAARSWTQGAHTLGRAVEAIGEDPTDAIGRLLLERRVLELLVGLGKGRDTGLRGIPQMPQHAATANRGQIDLVSETATVLFISQEIDGQRQIIETAVKAIRAGCFDFFAEKEFVKSGEIKIRILMTNERWFGVTYREDKPFVNVQL